MSNPDQIQHILFEELDIRGVLVGLDTAYQQLLERHAYPPAIRIALGEMLAAVALLGSTLKIEGRILLQAQGSGSVQLMMAEINSQRELRGIARYSGTIADQHNAIKLIGEGHLVISIEPDEGQRYQGIVPLEKDNLADCLTDYFVRSEQLPTQIHLTADGQQAAGFLLQVLPAAGTGEADWQHIAHIGATLSSEELLNLDNERLLHRLFHQEACRLYPPNPLQFKCDCSRARSLNALLFMNEQELLEMVQEQGEIEVDCQFCHARYRFDEADIRAQFSKSAHVPRSEQLH